MEAQKRNTVRMEAELIAAHESIERLTKKLDSIRDAWIVMSLCECDGLCDKCRPNFSRIYSLSLYTVHP